MSAENVEVVRRAFEAATRQPEPDAETLRELCHDDHILTTDWGAEGGTHAGLKGFRQAITMVGETFAEWQQEVDELVDVDDETVVVLGRLLARGGASGAPVVGPWAAVVKLRDGRLASTRWFNDREVAFASVGMLPPHA
jgi:ketosteroid isomerase-like protein